MGNFSVEASLLFAALTLMAWVGLVYALIRAAVHGLAPRLGDDRAVLIAGVLAGLAGGASGLGVMAPEIYERVFVGGASERAELVQFENERREGRDALEMTGVTGVAVTEYDQQTERLVEPMREAVVKAERDRAGLVQLLTLLCLVPALIGSVIHTRQHEARARRWDAVMPAVVAMGVPVVGAGLVYWLVSGWFLHDLEEATGMMWPTALPGMALIAVVMAGAVPLAGDLLTTLKLNLRRGVDEHDAGPMDDLPQLLQAVAGWGLAIALVAAVWVITWVTYHYQPVQTVAVNEAGPIDPILRAAWPAAVAAISLVIGAWSSRIIDRAVGLRRGLGMLLPWVLAIGVTWLVYEATIWLAPVENDENLLLLAAVLAGAVTAGIALSHSARLGGAYDRSWRVISLPAAGVAVAFIVAKLNVWTLIDWSAWQDWVTLIIIGILIGDLRALGGAAAVRWLAYRDWAAAMQSGMVLASGSMWTLVVGVALHWSGVLSGRVLAMVVIATLAAALLSGPGLRVARNWLDDRRGAGASSG